MSDLVESQWFHHCFDFFGPQNMCFKSAVRVDFTQEIKQRATLSTLDLCMRCFIQPTTSVLFMMVKNAAELQNFFQRQNIWINQNWWFVRNWECGLQFMFFAIRWVVFFRVKQNFVNQSLIISPGGIWFQQLNTIICRIKSLPNPVSFNFWLCPEPSWSSKTVWRLAVISKWKLSSFIVHALKIDH